ncbi:hypothetical protein ARSQ2_00738 [Arsenophonus endosymbiont of Bemisia tabaci Q2]|nr:hypothetical protein ARSQ2_00738 [Arsenophonus endosymbiont of Bemisia tabaci Q2]
MLNDLIEKKEVLKKLKRSSLRFMEAPQKMRIS